MGKTRDEQENAADSGCGICALASESTQRYLVPALMRGLAILQELSGERRHMTLSEVAATLQVTRSSAYRLLVTLGHLGFVDFRPRQQDLRARRRSAAAWLRLSRLARSGRSGDAASWCGCATAPAGRRISANCTGAMSSIWRACRPAVPSPAPFMSALGFRRSVTTMGRVLLSELPDGEIRELYRDEPAALRHRRATPSLAELIAPTRDGRPWPAAW